MTRSSSHCLLLLLVLMLKVVVGRDNVDPHTPGDDHSRPRRTLPEHPHTHLTAPELIEVRGYPVEVHYVTTQDGYILELHRIPHGRLDNTPPHIQPDDFTLENVPTLAHTYQDVNTLPHANLLFKTNPFPNTFYTHPFPNSLHRTLRNTGGAVMWAGQVSNMTLNATSDDIKASSSSKRSSSRRLRHSLQESGGGRRVAFLQHGVFSSSADFVVNDPDQALAFILADEGYDVWIGNTRGNFYGQRHVKLSSRQPEFWDFSWNEVGRYDIPAMLSYARDVTGVKQVYYVGHSLGGSGFFIMMNYHPYINSWIRVMAALAPAAYVQGRHVPLSLIAPLTNVIDGTLQHAGVFELLPLTYHSMRATSTVCGPSALTNFLCVIFYFIAGGGPNHVYLDKEYLPVILSHFPSGVGLHIFTHLLQLHHSGGFHAYDYGHARNLVEYGTPSPPDFTLNSVTVPVGVFWAEGDAVVAPEGMQLTLSKLPRLVLNRKVPLPDYNHLDFLFAENAADLVYRHVVQLFQDFSD
ncbi:lipase 3-like isoform X2 [Cherax quadricarinatus]|uniref:lipase 3-like isoform X2 n=1 Tax=Cherax quadricarinatus TaxID=27406 RepID=UPI00387E48C1